MHTCLHAFIHTYLHTYIHSWIHKPSKKFQLWCLNLVLQTCCIVQTFLIDGLFSPDHSPLHLAFFTKSVTGNHVEVRPHYATCATFAHKRKVRRLTPPERADNLNSFTPKSPEVCGRSLNRCWNMTSFWRYDSESICSMSSQIRCKHVNKLYIGIDFPK